MGEDGPLSRASDVNHCLIEVEVLEAPTIRYTQDNQMPIAEMQVGLDGLRPEDPPGQLKVVGFGSLAQDLQNRVQVGQRLVLEGRLRMSTIARADGLKEKKAEFTLSRLHPLGDARPARHLLRKRGHLGRRELRERQRLYEAARLAELLVVEPGARPEHRIAMCEPAAAVNL